MTRFRNLEDQLRELGGLVNALKTYNEAILRSVNAKGSNAIIKKEEGNIRRVRLETFRKEELVDHLVRAERVKSSAAKIYDAFMTTRTLESFMRELGIPSGQIDAFMEKFKSIATRDYRRMKRQYSGTILAGNEDASAEESEGLSIG